MNSQEEDQMFADSGWIKDLVARVFWGPLDKHEHHEPVPAHTHPDTKEDASGELRVVMSFDMLLEATSNPQREASVQRFVEVHFREDREILFPAAYSQADVDYITDTFRWDPGTKHFHGSRLYRAVALQKLHGDELSEGAACLIRYATVGNFFDLVDLDETEFARGITGPPATGETDDG